MDFSFAETEFVYFDNTQIRRRHLKFYNNVTLEIYDGRIERVISTNPNDYFKYCDLQGQDVIEDKNTTAL